MRQRAGIEHQRGQPGRPIGNRARMREELDVHDGARLWNRRGRRGRRALGERPRLSPDRVLQRSDVDGITHRFEIVRGPRSARIAVLRHDRTGRRLEEDPRQLGKLRGDAEQIERRVVAVLDHQIDRRLGGRRDRNAQRAGRDRRRGRSGSASAAELRRLGIAARQPRFADARLAEDVAAPTVSPTLRSTATIGSRAAGSLTR